MFSLHTARVLTIAFLVALALPVDETADAGGASPVFTWKIKSKLTFKSQTYKTVLGKESVAGTLTAYNNGQFTLDQVSGTWKKKGKKYIFKAKSGVNKLLEKALDDVKITKVTYAEMVLQKKGKKITGKLNAKVTGKYFGTKHKVSIKGKVDGTAK